MPRVLLLPSSNPENFFGSLPGEPGKTIRKAGAPFALIIQDSYELYNRIKFVYETGGISYETWKKFDVNQKWRLRFVGSGQGWALLVG
ncbi:hypothetical protein TrCOL_g25 [Triparma columacea]|uniref:Uncharacterized protein n=1 Tax=Triparma columacea TaxID=722753 RepID=A0A9W7FY88_9STRA|nr:hypothetical protein TrCOL_g25 [Triparma columacea]